ncbi:uncharacterized protein NSD isoform X2 [Lepeophtheirus salmonis]|uniref:uncharacterized protein NSD isoform X2 n=2 Tax=Lepeophtheirus salmonis TaxID=72036 RepID=UPI001AE3FA19|nr:histone-lysine N-methyltransferase NSD2-like isoform X2 [Lepeophtheirus salmonis]
MAFCRVPSLRSVCVSVGSGGEEKENRRQHPNPISWNPSECSCEDLIPGQGEGHAPERLEERRIRRERKKGSLPYFISHDRILRGQGPGPILRSSKKRKSRSFALCLAKKTRVVLRKKKREALVRPTPPPSWIPTLLLEQNTTSSNPFNLKNLIVKCRPLEMDKMWSTWNTLVLKNEPSPSSSTSSSCDSIPPFPSSRSPSPTDSVPPDRKRIFRLFCEKEKPKLDQKYPGTDPKEMKILLKEAWDQMTLQKKNAYLLNFAPPPETPLPPDGEELCPAKGCPLTFSPSADRQIIMKHWFKCHSLPDLHVLYTSSLWKRRVPQPISPQLIKSDPFSPIETYKPLESSHSDSPENIEQQNSLLNSANSNMSLSPSKKDSVVPTELLPYSPEEQIVKSLNDHNEVKQEEEKEVPVVSPPKETKGRGRPRNVKPPSTKSKKPGKAESAKLEFLTHCEYKPGDLVWARIGDSNFWPSVVTIDPQSIRENLGITDNVVKLEESIPMEVEDEFAKSNQGIFNRFETKRGFKYVEFHVDFFGFIRRAWVSARQIFPFTGIEDFEKYLQIYQKVYKGKFNNFSKSNNEKWNVAVKDAQTTCHLTGPERIKRIQELQTNSYQVFKFSRKRKLKSNCSSENEPESINPTKKRKVEAPSELIASIPRNVLENEKKKLKSAVNLFCLANKDRVIEEEEDPKMSEKDINRILMTLWKNLAPTERKFYRQELARLSGVVSNEKLKKSLSLRQKEMTKKKEIVKQLKQPSPSPSTPSTPKVPKAQAEMIGIFKNERFCILCEDVSMKPGDLITCQGTCGNSYHIKCIDNSSISSTDSPTTSWKCKDCVDNIQRCFLCKKGSSSSDKEGDDKDKSKDNNVIEHRLMKCTHKGCIRLYHPSCLTSSSLWPQTIFKPKQILTCPAHMCHTCASDNISNPVMKYSAKLLKCVRCPTSYHSGDYCVAAGTIQITSTAIICPKHTSNNNFTNSKSINNVSKKGSSKHINVSWCFICSSGGSLICCDFCPASFHSECLNLPNLPEGKYYCQTCCNGRMPLYREVVWVKLGAYRWWPAAVVHPSELPENVNRLNHQTGDFPVKFCGSNEYSWVSHGRTFLYEKGDSDKMPEGSFCSKKSITESFRKGLVEAAEIHLHYLGAKTKREAKNVQKKPPLYQKIKTNRPYGDVPVYTDASSEVQVCNCDHKSENPCNEDSDCINRMLMVECQMSTCPAKDRCRNMQFQRRSYPPLRVAYTESRGWGLFVDKPIKKGRFIIEYVGDLITMEEFRNRLRKSQAAKEDENFYYMTMDSNRMIDAGPKGNIARFMNHSCDPNCETQKWTVNGDTRVGIFTLKDIPANTELTFNYKFEAVGEVKKTCLCGAVNCSGYIGKKPASLKNNGEVTPRSSQSKKKVKKFKLIKAWEDVCFRCYKGGEVLMCDHKTCPKVYHLACLSRDKMPHGRWFCPWHHCVECGKSAVSYCVHCPNAYCKNHEATLVEHSLLKNICNEHDEEDINSLVNYYKSEDGSVRKMLTSPAAPMVKKAYTRTSTYKRKSHCATSYKKKSSDEDTQSSSESSNAINEVAVKSKDQSQKSDLDKTASEETATTNTTLTQKPFNNGVSVPKGEVELKPKALTTIEP